MIPETMSPIAYIEFVFQLVASCAANALFVLLACRIFTNRSHMSTNLMINVIFWSIGTIVAAIFAVYMMGIGNDKNTFSTSIILWTGTLLYALSTAVSITVAGLLFERIYLVSFPICLKTQRIQFAYLTTFVAILSIFYVTSAVILLKGPIPERTECPTFSCVLTSSLAIAITTPKMICGLLNALLSEVLRRKLYQRHQRNVRWLKNLRQGTKIAQMAAINELVLNCLPTVLFLIFSVFKLQHWHLLGSFCPTAFATDSLFTSLIYYHVIMKKKQSTHGRRSTNNAGIATIEKKWVVYGQAL
ncbi:hypothetical protein M3Y95_01112500 [Aphelenchoides besseyi]|nr:hypothetical protein M3Y95_01112500 [Aphelenchoides besseyi]